ncbi:MAG: DUF4124 domain-containing protein [Gammaproteobacteria bacterium]|nr:DUF4124 domain-containing protein [Gammaproteobacteria bacterium]
MKLFGKLLIATLIIGLLLPFTILKGKDGRPLMSFSSLKMPEIGVPDIPSLPKSTLSDLKAEIGDNRNLIYQWTDGSGNVQFTNSAPPEGVEYTVKGYDPNTNVVKAVKSTEKELEEKDEAETENKLSAEPDGIASVYSPEKINKLIDDAKNVEKLLSDRLKQQNAIIGD